MGRSPRSHFYGAIFHVLGRGNGGAPIFSSDDDRLVFLGILHDVLKKTGAFLLAYCPMTNHYHLMIQVGEVPISAIMRRVLTRYAKHFNSSAHRQGHVFQARFKANLVEDQAYFLTALRYIHENPVEAGICDDPASYVWSSHRQFIGPIRSVALDVDVALAKLGSTRSEAMARYRALMGLPPAEPRPTFDETPFRSVPAQPQQSRPDLQKIADEVQESTGIDARGIPGRSRSRRTSKARREFCRIADRNGYGVAEIARCLGISAGSVYGHLHA